jgi:hypothetical protein
MRLITVIIMFIISNLIRCERKIDLNQYYGGLLSAALAQKSAPIPIWYDFCRIVQCELILFFFRC